MISQKKLALLLFIVPFTLYSQDKIDFKPRYDLINEDGKLVSSKLKVVLVSVNTTEVIDGQVFFFHSLLSEQPITVKQYLPFIQEKLESGMEIPSEWLTGQIVRAGNTFSISENTTN